MLLKDFIKSVVPVSENDAVYIASHFQPLTIKQGDHVLQKGNVSDHYIFLEEGLLRSYLYDLDGNEVTTDFFHKNNIAFEITSFFNRTPSDTFMQAVTDCKGSTITYDRLNSLFHNRPAFRDFGRAILVREFVASKKRNYAMINQTAEQRYKNLLSQKAEIIQQAPLKHIASYLGVTDSTLSRIRSKI